MSRRNAVDAEALHDWLDQRELAREARTDFYEREEEARMDADAEHEYGKPRDKETP